jgi:tetratricopeptide (TPR) repeat protein
MNVRSRSPGLLEPAPPRTNTPVEGGPDPVAKVVSSAQTARRQMVEPSNAVFISYRRDVGGILAMALYQHLAAYRVDAFYDIESIRAGQFDTIILNQIAARPYFLLVLTPGTLERAGDPNDWVRREIEQALSTRRVIVPIHTPNFDFGDLERFLPDGVGREVQRFNAQELPQKWFKFAVQQLVEEFLVPTEIEPVTPSAEEQAVVERVHEAARAAPEVTEVQLSAQEYFERAYAREKDDLDGKIADYSEAIRLDPGYATVFNNRGNARGDKGDFGGAIADYDQAIRLDPGYADAFYNRAKTRSDWGDLEGAIADYDEAIRLNPRDAVVFSNRGTARFDAGDLDGAIADYDEAIRLDPGYAVAYYNRGNTRRGKGDLKGAIGDFDEAIRLDPGYAAAFNNRGTVRRDKGDRKGAIADFDEAIRLDPEDVDAFYNRGLARRDMRDREGAIVDLDEAIRLDPGYAAAISLRGLVRFDKGDHAGAIADYDEAIRLNPEYADVFYNRGLARRARGDLEGAIADVELGARLAPGDRAFPRLLKKLRKARGR